MTGDAPPPDDPPAADDAPAADAPPPDDAPAADEAIVLDETIHQPTRLRIMTLLVSVPEADRLAYGFVQESLGLTGGNLTTHLRKLEEAGYLVTTKQFLNSKPRTWVQATPAGQRAFADYLANLERALNWRPPAWPAEAGPQRTPSS